MTRYPQLADQLTDSLALALPPVAVTLYDAPPTTIPHFDGVVPAGCAFWQAGMTKTFATSTADHELCAIGVHTHHLSKPSGSFQGELQETLKAMVGLDYVRDEEVAAIPVLQREARYIVYGPLSLADKAPDVVLLFAHSQQGLIISEAVQRVDRGIPPALGRPACAVIPHVVNGGTAALSLGCCGARAYLDGLTDSVALWALPGGKLEDYCREIGTLANANKTLTTFHARRRHDVEAGEHPNVRQSLDRAFA